MRLNNFTTQEMYLTQSGLGNDCWYGIEPSIGVLRMRRETNKITTYQQEVTPRSIRLGYPVRTFVCASVPFARNRIRLLYV